MYSYISKLFNNFRTKKNDTDKTTVNDRGAMSIIKTDISNVQLWFNFINEWCSLRK